LKLFTAARAISICAASMAMSRGLLNFGDGSDDQ
jgi:hypothetical protein